MAVKSGDGSTVLVVGLGNMGRPMAMRLRDAGYVVIGFDAGEAAAQAARADGLAVAATLTDGAADADLVVLMLPSSDVVEAVMHDAGLERILAPGTLVVDMGSSDPVRTRRLSNVLADGGLRLVDAPVSGGVAGAVAGTLTIMVGGSPADVDEAWPVVSVFGTARRTGDVGSGHALKALNNLLSAAHLLATAEAMQAGRRFGLSDEVMLEVLNSSSGRSFSTEHKWPRFVVPESYDSGFGLRLLVKDVRTAVDLATSVGLPPQLGAQVLELWENAARALPAEADHTEIARLIGADDGTHPSAAPQD